MGHDWTRNSSFRIYHSRFFESLIRQVRDPKKFLLNYSGESTIARL